MHIALYKPDIPQNTAAIIRLGACLSLKIHIIEPCGFNLHDSRFKRVVMDYIGFSKVFRYQDYDDFINKNKKIFIINTTFIILHIVYFYYNYSRSICYFYIKLFSFIRNMMVSYF